MSRGPELSALWKAGGSGNRLEAAAHSRKALERAGQRLRRIAGEARVRAHLGRRELQRALVDHPLAAGALGFAAGLLAALAWPPSRWEVRVLGTTRQRLVAEAARAGREAGQAAAQAARRQARREELLPADLAAKVRQVAVEAAEAARDGAWQSVTASRDPRLGED
jgi:hypothetical protein